MVVNGRAMKRPKRRAPAPADAPQDLGAVPPLDGTFRLNVGDFLARYGREPPSPSALLPLPPQLRPWRVSLRPGPGAEPVDLDVVEEDVARARSVYCDQCRVVGWSGHPVCGKRYHFIIRNNDNVGVRANQLCIQCGSLFDASDTRCANCNYELGAEDMEDWAYRQLDDSTHLLHGVVHANGFGHLLRVNGREGGSKALTGSEIMDFWDHLCKVLRVRKISVMDISKKYGLEYRLLHAITTGRTWYGEWGYEFGAGSFALTAEGYLKAVDALSNLTLSRLFSHNRGPRTQLHDVIAFYWSLSDHRPVTIRDLFCFLLELIRDAHKRNKMGVSFVNKRATGGDILCAWTVENVTQVEESMLKILRAAGVGRWISWRSLRGAVCHSQQSTVLLDYCLKGLAGKVTDDGLMMVVSKCNADTNAIEFRLETVMDRPKDQVQHRSLVGGNDHNPIPDLCRPTEQQLIRDLRFLYESLLNPDTMYPYKPSSVRELAMASARRLLDCKQFVKNYDRAFPEQCNTSVRHVWCDVFLLDQPKDYTAPPTELVIMPVNATLGDLKLAVSKALQETYLIFQKFQVEEVLNLGRISDCTTINLLLGDDCTIVVRGKCDADHLRLAQYRKERGTENWTVECVCGAQDDDGERMMACDSCGVWRHTRCMGIHDLDEVPKKFVCWKCAAPTKIKVLPRKPPTKRGRENGGGKPDSDVNTAMPLSRVCTKRSKGGDNGKCNNDDEPVKTSMSLSRISPKRCREEDGRCKDDSPSPTASCLTDANQFGYLTLVG